ncbi:MAG: hypothetical protein IAE77_30680 [Prosthecobacter sp.]|jgi:hypothetical protein|uniref:hypothetical protein n=1 Tax=Prosthecobacter sp. TaxID=1965333 RepID=UPI0019EE4D12|nr:hypothetical protein [Prosthecobacter sp.]MBE2287864.1 hypothetical protein [Prosthecobacter sp.]
MNTRPFISSPRWLPLRLLLGGVIAACVLLLVHGTMPEAWPEVAPPGLWVRCASSLAVLAAALTLALTLGLTLGLLARRMHRLAGPVVAILGLALSCLPVVVVAWGFVGWWTGSAGWPVETLLPAQLPEGAMQWHTALARALWEFLAPVLVLAVPLTGEMIHAVVTDASLTTDLDFSLRARGVPADSRLWRHHLRQLLPVMRVRVQWLCLVAPVYLIVVEDVLRFMGWGGWMAENIRSGGVEGLALGIASGGAMMALLCLAISAIPGGLTGKSGYVAALSWQPWFLWAFGVMTLPVMSGLSWIALWLAVLIAGAAAWLRAWNDIAARLPVEASRVLGASERSVWRQHVAPVQMRMLAAWICAVAAQALFWMVLACALRPALLHGLGDALAGWCRPQVVDSMEDAARTLADPSAILEAGGSTALAALCLLQISRILQPRPL